MKAVFGVTDSPREVERKAKLAAREERLLQRDRLFLLSVERDPDGMPCRISFQRNPHYQSRLP